jgi:hypothetical protein
MWLLNLWSEDIHMCIHNPDNQRGWTADCPDSARCLCGYFVECGPAFQPRQSTLSTVAHIVVAISLVWLALSALVLGLVLLGSQREEQRS